MNGGRRINSHEKIEHIPVIFESLDDQKGQVTVEERLNNFKLEIDSKLTVLTRILADKGSIAVLVSELKDELNTAINGSKSQVVIAREYRKNIPEPLKGRGGVESGL